MNMNLEFIKWLEQNRYTHWATTHHDGHIWIVNNKGVWEWNQIKDYEY
jgi:hypothetical protein